MTLPGSGQHGHQGRRGRRMACAQAWGRAQACLAQGSSGRERGDLGSSCSRVHRQWGGRCACAVRPARADLRGRTDRFRHGGRCLRYTRLPRRHREPGHGGNHPIPPHRAAVEERQSWGGRPERSPPGHQASRPDHLAEVERLPSPKSRCSVSRSRNPSDDLGEGKGRSGLLTFRATELLGCTSAVVAGRIGTKIFARPKAVDCHAQGDGALNRFLDFYTLPRRRRLKSGHLNIG